MTSDLDPRQLPGLQLHADEFGVGQRQLGRLDAEILADPLGLRLVSFESATDSFTAQGSGGWFVGDDGDYDAIRRRASTRRTSRQMLAQLGFAPFVEAETAEVTASVYWPGPPSGAWLDHIGGDLALRAEKGSLVDVEPGGAGRVVGLLSISALPRRLALDFRDVFNRGLVFDDITADFVDRRRQRLHRQPEADGPGRRGRPHRPHGPARPRLSAAGRRHGGARQGAADRRRAARRARRSRPRS